MKKTNRNFNLSARSFKQLVKELRATLKEEWKFGNEYPWKIIDAIEQSKDLNARAGIGFYEQSLLDFAADQKCPKMAALLLENGADPNAIGLFRVTPLMIAAIRNSFDVASLLIDSGAVANVTFTDRLTGEVRTPLSAAYRDFFVYKDYDPRIVKLLANTISQNPQADLAEWEKRFLEDVEERGINIEKWLSLGVNVDCKGREGRTPLLTAIYKEDASNVCTLIENGASLTVTDDKGRTVKDYLRFVRNEKIESLVKNAAKDPAGKRPAKGIEPQ